MPLDFKLRKYYKLNMLVSCPNFEIWENLTGE